jgi:hypothetical protein
VRVPGEARADVDGAVAAPYPLGRASPPGPLSSFAGEGGFISRDALFPTGEANYYWLFY